MSCYYYITMLDQETYNQGQIERTTIRPLFNARPQEIINSIINQITASKCYANNTNNGLMIYTLYIPHLKLYGLVANHKNEFFCEELDSHNINRFTRHAHIDKLFFTGECSKLWELLAEMELPIYSQSDLSEIIKAHHVMYIQEKIGIPDLINMTIFLDPIKSQIVKHIITNDLNFIIKSPIEITLPPNFHPITAEQYEFLTNPECPTQQSYN